jgi:hypothetical protein
VAHCNARSFFPDQALDALGGLSIDEDGILLVFFIPLCRSLLGFEQLLHGHRLVEGGFWPGRSVYSRSGTCASTTLIVGSLMREIHGHRIWDEVGSQA